MISQYAREITVILRPRAQEQDLFLFGGEGNPGRRLVVRLDRIFRCRTGSEDSPQGNQATVGLWKCDRVSKDGCSGRERERLLPDDTIFLCHFEFATHSA